MATTFTFLAAGGVPVRAVCQVPGFGEGARGRGIAVKRIVGYEYPQRRSLVLSYIYSCGEPAYCVLRDGDRLLCGELEWSV